MSREKKDFKKECESVNGSWYEYFFKVCVPAFDDEACAKSDQLLRNMYGDFFDRNLERGAGPLLSLGAGFGQTEIPLARKGFKIIGSDNDERILELLRINGENYASGMVETTLADLYGDFHRQFIGRGIQACISFGVLEHFARQDLMKVINKQFLISPLMICMMPIKTSETLKTFGAEEQPEGNIDKNGIYRNFWTAEFWEKEIFGSYKIIDRCYPVNHSKIGQIDMVTFAVKKN